ncbi:hypothetical protein ACLMNJ_26780 [Streptomyces seoulensis]
MTRTAFTVGGAWLLAAAVMGASAGCSSSEPKRGYAVPKTLCGVSVPTDALSRLLPPSGDHLTVKDEATVADAVTGCDVSVDGDVVLSIEKERIDAGRSAWNIAAYDRRLVAAEQADGGKVAYAGRQGVTVVSCREKDNQDEEVSVYVRTLKPGRQDESALRDFLTRYRDAFGAQRPC